jgi:4-hydroxy-tetrahydrodipicolinate synthase
VDAVFVSAPYYFIHTPEDMLMHFERILDATDLPLIIYNNPFNTHNAIPLSVVQELGRRDQVIGIKDSGGNFAFTLDLLRSCQSPTFRVFTGTEELFAASILMGAEGAVLAIPVIAPQLCRELFQAARAGDKPRALELQREFNSLIPLLADDHGQITDASFLGAVKTALAVHGLCKPMMCQPLSPISAAHTERIRTTLQTKGLLRQLA